MRKIKGRNGGTLHVLEKGEQINWGRPRKFVSTLKAHGYTKSQVNDCLAVLLALTVDELKEVIKTPGMTVLEITVGKALLSGVRKGSLYYLETLLTRVYGKPTEKNETTLTGDVKVTLNIGM